MNYIITTPVVILQKVIFEKMSSIGTIKTKLKPIQNNQKQSKKPDAFQNQLHKHQRSKTDHILNLIYSILVGVLSGVLTKKHFKYGKLFGLIMALSSYIINRKASKIEIS